MQTPHKACRVQCCHKGQKVSTFEGLLVRIWLCIFMGTTMFTKQHNR